MDGNRMSLNRFYADEIRARSEEVSFGKRWYDHERGQCQVCWLRDTGELIVVAALTTGGLGFGDGADSILSAVAGFAVDLVVEGALSKANDKPSEVEILAVIPDERTVGALLAGWGDHEQSGSGLLWLRDRTAQA